MGDFTNEEAAYLALQAQVVVMREALEQADRYVASLEWARPSLVEVWPIRGVLDKALGATPTVLWSGQGRTTKFYDIELDVKHGDPFQAEIIERGMFAEWRVLVLKGEQ